jgi:hypothetical protein
VALRRLSNAMRKFFAICGAAYLLFGCGTDSAPNTGPSSPYAYSPYVYHDWLYLHSYWYDDDFWEWADDHPACCYERDDVKQGLQTWYQGLDPNQQQQVRDRVQNWMDENGIVPEPGQSPRDLVLRTASERWAALTPTERQQWLDQRSARIEQRRAMGSSLTLEQRAALRERAANLSPEQRAALRESGRGASFNRPGRMESSLSSHPSPGRSGLSSGMRYRAAGFGGRGGRGGRGR